MGRRRYDSDPENHDRWLVSYADFITLLFAFFVVMYSVSRVDNRRLAQVVRAIQFALHFKGSGGVGEPPLFRGPPSDGGRIADLRAGDAGKAVSEAARQAELIRRRLQRRLGDLLLDRSEAAAAVLVQAEGRRLSVRLSAARFFDTGQAALRPEALPVLDAVVAELAPLQRPVRVEGHADDSFAGERRFRDDWELSSSRAAAVVSYMQSAHGIEGKRLSAAGYGRTRPLAPDPGSPDLDRNRRIDLVLDVGGTELGAFVPAAP
jgi:chemotaxis protein MotB